MWGMRSLQRRRGSKRSRSELVALILGLLLVVSQSVGAIAANASGSRDRSGAFSSTTTVDHGGSGAQGSVPRAASVSMSGQQTAKPSTPLVMASTPVDSTDIDAFEGLISTGDPTDDSDWTPGNLCQSNVPCYHELDNVPHRIILKNLTPGTEYQITVLIDFQDNAGHAGYDEINGVTGSSGTPDPTVTYDGTTATGCGASTLCKSYTFTFTPTAANPEIRFNAHLAIGAHLFGGSSLSARILGSAKNVPLPVNDILLDVRAHKFNDLNDNATQDNGEADLAGWTMTLYSGPSCQGSPVDVTGNAGTDPNPGVTDASGNVDWTNLSASDGDKDGRFSVEETLQAGWQNTTPLCQEVGIVANQNLATFGNQQLAPALSITKSASSGSVQYGNAFSYTITVENTGNAQATNVLVTDDLADSLTGVSASYDVDPGSAGGTGSCTVGAGNSISCNVGTLAASDGAADGPDEVVVTIQATAPDACGTITNTAHVSSDQDATGTDSNEVQVEVTGCAPDLTITKSASTGSVAPGGSFSWTITVVNAGNAPANDVVVTDDLPDPVSGVSAAYDVDPGSAGGTGTCTVGAGNSITCDIGTLAANDGSANGPDTVQVTVDVTAPETCGALENTAQVQLGTQQPISSNTSTVNVVGCAPGLGFSKSGPSSVGQGGTVEYHVSVSNSGNAASDPVTVTDDVPSSLSGVAASYSVNGGPSQACQVSGNSVTCDLGSLQPGDDVDITITASAPDDNTCPTLENTASVWVGESEVPESTNTVTTTVTGCTTPTPPPPPPIGIQILKGGPALAHVGDTITYTFDVSLTTSTPLSNVTVTDPICDAAPVLGSKSGGDQDDVLEAGETWHYTCQHLVTGSDPDPLPNTATVTGRSSDGRTASDQDSHLVDLIHPAIRIVKTADPTSGSVGDTITYTYEVTNTGDVTLYDISVDDDVIGHICDIASLDPGASQTCTADYVIPETTASIENVGTAVGSDETGTKVKDDDKASVAVVLATTVTPPTTTPPGGTAFTGASGVVPLASLALVLLLAGSGLLFWSRRRKGNASA